MSHNEGNNNEQSTKSSKSYQFGDITKFVYKSITKKRVQKGVKSTIERTNTNPDHNDQPGAQSMSRFTTQTEGKPEIDCNPSCITEYNPNYFHGQQNQAIAPSAPIAFNPEHVNKENEFVGITQHTFAGQTYISSCCLDSALSPANVDRYILPPKRVTITRSSYLES